MLSKNFKPKAVHKRFHDKLARLGCIVTEAPAQLHHVVGSSYRQNGVWLGQWWLIPLSPELHMDGNINVTTNKPEFYQRVGTEKELFWETLNRFTYEYHEMPVPINVLVEIYFCRENSMYMLQSLYGDEKAAFDEFIWELQFRGMEDIVNETKKRINEENHIRDWG